MEQVQCKQNAGKPKCNHCNRTKKFGRAYSTVLTELYEAEAKQHANLFRDKLEKV